jgi:hypothetical protein
MAVSARPLDYLGGAGAAGHKRTNTQGAPEMSDLAAYMLLLSQRNYQRAADGWAVGRLTP